MEFLNYGKAVENLTTGGVSAITEGEGDDQTVRFELTVDDADTASIGPEPQGDAGHTLNAAAEDLGDMLDSVLHSFHVTDAMIVPVKTWRNVLDLVAFDLAEDEGWQEMDAEASLHARGRDPLLFSPDERGTMLALVNALVKHGEGDNESVTVLAVGSPAVVELRHDPAELRVACDRQVMDTLMSRLNH